MLFHHMLYYKPTFSCTWLPITNKPRNGLIILIQLLLSFSFSLYRAGRLIEYLLLISLFFPRKSFIQVIKISFDNRTLINLLNIVNSLLNTNKNPNHYLSYKQQ